jgi:hypothetical protein
MAATAAEQSILMVGEPGSGKSGALHDLAEDLVSRSVDVLYLSADRLDAASLGSLRLELGISHDLCETLENWQGIGPAFLLIDSLDAARADPASRTLRDLLRRATDLKRWRVVASIRKFDLRYSPELQYLFKGTPAADSSDPEFARVSHVLVKRLSDTELGQVASQSSEMAACLPLVPVDLVNVVFNLKILAELIDEGVDLRGANPIQTQLELLELYWKHRVLKWPTRDVSEELLRSVVRTMVKRKTMRADRLAIAPAGTELHELLSRGVLVEWQVLGATDRNKLAFSHHVIFDFAVSTLLFRGDDDTLISALLDDPQLVLISRPSIVFHYHHVWSHDEHVLKRFWSLVSRLQDSTLPSIGKLIGPSVAVERATAAEDFGPLIWSLRAPGSVHEASEQTLNYVIGSLFSSDQPLGGLGAGPWSELAMDISYALGPSVAYNLRGLLSRMLERVDLLTDAQLTHCGVASRRLLEYAWSQSRRDRYLVIAGLENVCKTYRSDKTSSSALLWRALELDHVAQYGYEELPWIARQLGAVLAVDASFVEAVYCASFGHEETSAEPVQMGSSRLLALTSTRKQDFEGARWELGRFFAKFMSFDPVHATSTLITCVDSYVKNDRRISGLTAANSSAQEFELLGTNARIAQDYSSIWDREVVSHKDDIVVMLDVFGGYLKDLMAGESGGTVLQRLISLVASQNRWAAIWRRIIWAATEDPGGLGIKLKDFAFAKPILSGIDTAWAAGEFLRAVYPILNGSDKKRAEEAILGIVPREGAQDSHQALEYQRDQLLGCLPRDQLVLEGSIKVVDALESTGAVPANVPPFQMAISSAPFGEKEYLAEEGVQVDSEQNRRVQELEIPIRDFASKYMNAEPPQDEVQKLSGPLGLLWRELLFAEASGVDPRQSDYAWGVIAEACSRILTMRVIDCAETSYSLAMEVLLAASSHRVPEPDPETDTRFDEMQSWGGPAARIEAASGLVRFCAHHACATEGVLKAVERLSSDPVPAVRFQVAFHLNALFESRTELMWELAERFARMESSRGVLHGLLAGCFQPLARVEPDRIALLIQTILDRTTDGPGSGRLREVAMETLSGLFLWRGIDLAARRIESVVDTIPIDADNARYVLAPVRRALTHGPVEKPDPVSAAVRARAFQIVRRLLTSALTTLENLEKQGTPFNTWSEPNQVLARKASEVVDFIGREIYFASGEFKKDRDGEEIPSQASRERFYNEAKECMDLLCTCGIPSVAHHLLETLESMIMFDQRAVFLQIGRVIEGGKRGGYQYESMAAELAVRMVERYIAEYRPLLETDDECRGVLITILDTFISAGWPVALRLSYRLQDIFR